MFVWDIAGGGRERNSKLQRHYFEGINGIMFAVDSSDAGRIEEARNELQVLLREPQLAAVPVVVFANKQDLKTALTVDEISKRLNLASITDRQWRTDAQSKTDLSADLLALIADIESAIFKDGEGIYEGVDWLSGVLTDQVMRQVGAEDRAAGDSPGFFSSLWAKMWS